jgi:hypothetical protein
VRGWVPGERRLDGDVGKVVNVTSEVAEGLDVTSTTTEVVNVTTG